MSKKKLAMEDRRIILLKATHALLKKCDQGPYVKNVMEQTVFYDEADCDGSCLMMDIEDCLLEHGIELDGRDV